jgi:crotonobetainyl-CoA:carnitine CoA-transferase CaiB-like acyl-CoA transferase
VISVNATQGAAPLHGIRVLDFSQTLAGPYCTWLLSCLGADVVKAEPPTGDYLRTMKHGTIFAATNRGKRSVVVDLRTPAGVERAKRMIPHFDVLLESLKPGTMARYGLSYETVQELNPRIVYASVSGFGQDGPYAGRPAYDPIAQAASGLMAATGFPDRQPVRVGTSIIDYGTGVYMALAICAALHGRMSTNRGCRIDANLLETAMSYMSQAYTHYSSTGEDAIRRGTANDSFAPFQMFDTADKGVFIGVGTNRMFNDFCQAFGLVELMKDERFATIQGRHDNLKELSEIVQNVVRDKPATEVIEKLLAVRIPTAEVLTAAQVMDDEHVVARKAVLPLDDPHLGRIMVSPFPVLMDGVTREPGTPAPDLGAHTAEVLGELDIPLD